jgi:prevent-host-death family protein
MRRLTMLEFRRDAAKVLEAVRRGERLLLTYRGKAVARLEPVRSDADAVADDDALLRVDEFSVDGPGRPLNNRDIDRLVYGA